MDIFLSIIKESWSLTLEMAPYLFLGFIAAGFLHVLIPVEMIGRHLGKESVSSVIKASVFGIPIPLCSCGVLPVAASIRKSGAGKSATLSFLITTPVTGVDSIMATWALLGWLFTLIRVVASLVIGFFTGFIMSFDFRKNDNSQDVDEIEDSCSDKDCCGSGSNSLSDGSKITVKVLLVNLKEVFRYAFDELPSSFAGSLLFGLISAGAISYFLPPDLIKQYLGSGYLGIVISTLIAIPLYICATGSIPIAAVMIANGFTPGAALAFLIAGPATNTVAILTVKNILGKKALVIYLVLIFSGAIGFGIILDYFNVAWKPAAGSHHMEASDSILAIISGSILILMLTVLYVKDKYLKVRNKIDIQEAGSMDNKIILSTPDISCQHCVGTVKKTLSQFSEIEEVRVDVDSKKVEIKLKEDIDKEKILSALDSAGYPSSVDE